MSHEDHDKISMAGGGSAFAMKPTSKVAATGPRMSAYLFIFMSGLTAIPALASDNFLYLPLEDLLKIEISSASRKVQQVQDVAAAVFVISRDDIARSGARSIPELLRMAPGVEVARIANNRWAVSIRGFNGRFANKLLVLKDGRSIYSPLFSGVMWEAEDAVLEDIERIEVIRGPSAAMWGSNAVSGVINIISRHPVDTLGTEISVATASDEPGAATLRHGFKLGNGDFQLSAKGFDLSPGKAVNGVDGNDSWRATRIGLRGEWPSSQGGRWLLAGEVFNSRADDRLDFTRYGSVSPLLDVNQTNRGSNISLRREESPMDGGRNLWQLTAETSDVSVETLIREERQTVGAEYQRNLSLGRHDYLWGASYRFSQDRITLASSSVLTDALFVRQQRNWNYVSVFAHDDYALIPEQLHLSGGIRLDHDNWSGPQTQADIRLAWTPDAASTWWTSLARAARTPSRLELDVPFTLAESAAVPPYVPAIKTIRLPIVDGALQAEIIHSLEAGFRQRVNEKLSIDITGFVSDYSGLVSLAIQAPMPVSPALVIIPVVGNNDASARTHGFEIAADWQVSPTWRIQPNYSRLYLRSPRLSDPLASASQDLWEGRVPRHRASLRSSWTLGEGRQFDLWLKYTSSLGNPQVPAYTALDLRYAFRIGKQVEVAIVGQNLLDQRHLEFVADYVPAQQIEIGRSLQIKGTWRF